MIDFPIFIIFWRYKLYHIVYETVNLINKKTYVGKHSSKNRYDDYLGSGSRLARAIKKYGRENFRRYEVAIFGNEDDAYEYEEFFIEANNCCSNSDEYYNIQKGGKGGSVYFRHSDYSKKKNSYSHKGKKRSGQALENIRKGAKKRKEAGHIPKGWLGKRDPEYIARMSQERKEFFKTDEGLECKLKLKEYKGEKNSQYGSRWINDGTTNKKIKRNVDLPPGWEYGRLVNHIKGFRGAK